MPSLLRRTISPSKMSSPAPLPYRDTNNTSVSYAPAPPSTSDPLSASPYDSDFEPLIPVPQTSAPTPLDDDSMARFTATGRPMPGFKHSGLQALSGDMYSLPQLLPKRYTDESIIPAIVVDVIARSGTEGRKEKRGWVSRLKGEAKTGESKEKGLTKVVYMPRGEYLKWFARDLDGKFVGTGEFKRWSEEELEEAFGKYKPVEQKGKQALNSVIR